MAGKPSPLLAGVPKDGSIRLLALPFTPAMEDGYVPAAFRADDYPMLIPDGLVVESVAVSAVLMAHNAKRRRGLFAKDGQVRTCVLRCHVGASAQPIHQMGNEPGSNLAGMVTPACSGGVAAQGPAAAGAVSAEEFRRFFARNAAARFAESPRATERKKLFDEFVSWTRKIRQRNRGSSSPMKSGQHRAERWATSFCEGPHWVRRLISAWQLNLRVRNDKSSGAVVPDTESEHERNQRGVRQPRISGQSLLRRKKLPGSMMDNPEDVARVREIKRLLDRIQQLPLVPEVPDRPPYCGLGRIRTSSHGPAIRTDRLPQPAGRRARAQFQPEPLALRAGDRAQHHCSGGARRSHYIGRRAPRAAPRRDRAQGLGDRRPAWCRFCYSYGAPAGKPGPAHGSDTRDRVGAHRLARPSAATAGAEVGAATTANPT